MIQTDILVSSIATDSGGIKGMHRTGTCRFIDRIFDSLPHLMKECRQRF